MCFRAFYKLYLNLTVSLPPRRVYIIWMLQLAGFFHFMDAVLSTNFGSTGRLHYFSTVHKVRAHASYMGVVINALRGAFFFVFVTQTSKNSLITTSEARLLEGNLPNT